jgi:hypothetical protein
VRECSGVECSAVRTHQELAMLHLTALLMMLLLLLLHPHAPTARLENSARHSRRGGACARCNTSNSPPASPCNPRELHHRPDGPIYGSGHASLFLIEPGGARPPRIRIHASRSWSMLHYHFPGLFYAPSRLLLTVVGVRLAR